MTTATATHSDAIYAIDQFVQQLEEQGYDFEDVIDSLLEYVELCDDIYANNR